MPIRSSKATRSRPAANKFGVVRSDVKSVFSFESTGSELPESFLGNTSTTSTEALVV